jgi:hypothetical protein
VISQLKKAATHLGRSAGLFFVPSEHDTFLVSFPRSGNTWIRSAIAELMFGESGECLEDIHAYIPTVGHNMPVWKMKRAPFRVVKSHEVRRCSAPSEKYRRVIYIIRDPRDVSLSHYRFCRQLEKYCGDYDSFLEDWLAGRVWPGSWTEHVNSWTAFMRDGEQREILIVRYEDISQDCSVQFRRVAEFLSLRSDDATIARVSERTTIEKMRKWEDKNRAKISGFRSIQNGGTQQWKKRMTERQSDMVVQYSENVMRRFGYI